MDFIRWIWGTIGDMFYDMAGDAIGFAIVAGILIVLVVPTYFILKALGFGPKRGARQTTLGEDLEELIHPPKPTPEQLEKVRRLEELGDQMRVFYRYALVALFLVGTWIAVTLFKAFEKDPGNKAFLQMYFGIGYLVFLGFVVGQFLAARPRARRKGHAATATFGVTFGSNPSDFSVDWMVGKPPAGEISESFEIDDSKLGIARAYMESGQSLDSICALINPEYRNWSAERQRAFQADLQTRLAAMKPVDET